MIFASGGVATFGNGKEVQRPRFATKWQLKYKCKKANGGHNGIRKCLVHDLTGT
jgi:hypothetical protein